MLRASSKVILTQKIAYANREDGKLAFRPLSLSGLFRAGEATGSPARYLGARPPAPRRGAARSAGGNPSVFSPAGHRSLRSKLYCVIVYSVKIPKGALTSYFVTLVRRFAERQRRFPPTASAVCPPRGKNRGEKISPGASVVTTKCRSKRRGQGREAAKRTLDRMSGVGRREIDAAKGEISPGEVEEIIFLEKEIFYFILSFIFDTL